MKIPPAVDGSDAADDCVGEPPIVDFQQHFAPRELIKNDPGDRLVPDYDALGAPSCTMPKLLYDLDEHVRMMDVAGIDAAWLTSAAGADQHWARSPIALGQRVKLMPPSM